MQTAGNVPLSPHQMWQFAVELDGFDIAFFTEVEGQNFSNEESIFAPAGSLFDEKTAGRMKFDDLTLRKGKSQVSTDNPLFAWQQQIADVNLGVGTQPSQYLRTLDVVEYDRTGNEIRRFRYFGSFLKSVKFGNYKGGSSETTIEEMTIAFQYVAQV